jgi:hypothetical protein
LAIPRRRLRTGCGGFDQAGLILLQTCIFPDGGGERDGWFLFRNFRQGSLDVELLVAGEREGCELARGREPVDDIADARARGERREEDFDFLRGG